MQDASGRTVVVGITISGTSGASDEQLARARELVDRIAEEIRAHGGPLW